MDLGYSMLFSHAHKILEDTGASSPSGKNTSYL